MDRPRGSIVRLALPAALALGILAGAPNRASAQFPGYGMGYGYGYPAGGFGYGPGYPTMGAYGYPGGGSYGYPGAGYGSYGSPLYGGGYFYPPPLSGYGYPNPLFGLGLSPLGVQSAIADSYILNGSRAARRGYSLSPRGYSDGRYGSNWP